jgi:hypothetical protein
MCTEPLRPLRSVVNAISTRVLVDTKRALGDNLAAYVLWFLWRCIRLPMFLLLAILEPLVSFVLALLALLGVLTAFFWKFIGLPHFPFLLVLGISLGFELALILCHRLLRFLSS